MEIKISKSILLLAASSIFVAIMFIVFFFVMTPISMLNIIPILGLLCSAFNAAVYLKCYNVPIIITVSKISFYTGWLYGKVELELSDIGSVKYTKHSMIFFTATEKRTLGLLFISKEDEITIFQHLQQNSVNVVY